MFVFSLLMIKLSHFCGYEGNSIPSRSSNHKSQFNFVPFTFLALISISSLWIIVTLSSVTASSKFIAVVSTNAFSSAVIPNACYYLPCCLSKCWSIHNCISSLEIKQMAPFSVGVRDSFPFTEQTLHINVVVLQLPTRGDIKAVYINDCFIVVWIETWIRTTVVYSDIYSRKRNDV